MKMRIATIALLVLVGALLSPTLAAAHSTKHKNEDDDVFVSNQQTTSSDFNIDAICPSGYEVITGGYEVLSPDISLHPDIVVDSNTFHFHFNSEGEAEADGWQVIGFSDDAVSVTIRVIASCEKEGKKE